MKKRYKTVNVVIQRIKIFGLKRGKKQKQIIHREKRWMEINQNKIFQLVSFPVADK